MNNSPLVSKAPFADCLLAQADAPGVWVTERDGLGIASIVVRRGQRAALNLRWRDRFHSELPRGPRREQTADVSVAGTGPESWLAMQENGGNAFAAALQTALTECASVTDQSDGYAVLRLDGPGVRATLAKLLPIDVHARVFPVGAVAGTMAAHLGATLWRLADRDDATPVFEIAVFRSLAGSFWHALTSSAAEFGLARRAPLND